MGVNLNGQFNDVNDSGMVQGELTLGTSQTELKVGGSQLANRQYVRVFNKSNSTIYIGPAGLSTTTGEPLYKKQWAEFAIGSQQLFALVESGTENVIVWEFA